MTLRDDASLTDVAFAVCSALESSGERAVLCGGSAATFYAPEAYQSRDLDFVLSFSARAKPVDEALRSIGYARTPERLYAHPTIVYTVEFPPGPLAIGSDTIELYATEHREAQILHVLSRTDVVRDRCMHYWAWGDQVALRTALDVARVSGGLVDLASVRAWTDRELESSAIYDRFRRDYFMSELHRVLGGSVGE